MIPITIQDPEYTGWVKSLIQRYRSSQIKAAVSVNSEMLRFYWELGHDIVVNDAENNYGAQFYERLSADLRVGLNLSKAFSPRTLRYAKRFYELYSQQYVNLQQLVANSGPASTDNIQTVESSSLLTMLFSIPWGHHTLLIDKCSANPSEALFYVHQTIANGWSRNMLMNFISTGLYERQGKALTNFDVTLPATTSDLACELLKDPYDFAFTGLTEEYNERRLKEALLANISKFLIELGTGFAYVGKEYRLMIGENERFIDLLFYNLTLSCYVVVEVKIGKFDFADIGQLGGYVVACNHLLRKAGRDNPTIGLLICKEKDNLIAKYALESSAQPIGISEYDLSRLYPERVEGTIPTIDEIEKSLTQTAE